MPTYIALLNWTQQGVSKVGSSAKRLDAGRKAFKKAGVEIKDVYLTMGRHDLVCLIEAPDDETYAKQIESKYTKISDPKILNENYQQGLRVWNKDMTVDPAAIRVVLDDCARGQYAV